MPAGRHPCHNPRGMSSIYVQWPLELQDNARIHIPRRWLLRGASAAQLPTGNYDSYSQDNVIIFHLGLHTNKYCGNHCCIIDR